MDCLRETLAEGLREMAGLQRATGTVPEKGPLQAGVRGVLPTTVEELNQHSIRVLVNSSALHIPS